MRRTAQRETSHVGGAPPMSIAKAVSRKKERITRAIARAFLAGWPEPEAMVAQSERALGYRWTFLAETAARAIGALGARASVPGVAELSAWIARDDGFLGLWLRADVDPTDDEALELGIRLEARGVHVVSSTMRPAHGWPLPSIATEPELLEFLALHPDELEQLAGLHGRERRVPEGPLRNYRYLWRRKRGRAAPRLIEAPKTRLKSLQRRIARKLLAVVPLHDAAHGFCAGRSIVSHAAQHSGREIVIKMDLRDFFPSISGARVLALFRGLGYPCRVAHLLMLLTTNTAPGDVFRSLDARHVDPALRKLLRGRHLPPGAPSSPSIANLCAHRLDRRLAALARCAGAAYGRYGDDLAFSGGHSLARSAESFIAHVTLIAAEEGFQVNARKTRSMRAGARQRITGVVVNRHPNVPRADYERLKAILHNCVRRGPSAENREHRADFRGWLSGKVGFVAMIHPERGRRLHALLEQIEWPPVEPE